MMLNASFFDPVTEVNPKVHILGDRTLVPLYPVSAQEPPQNDETRAACQEHPQERVIEIRTLRGVNSRLIVSGRGKNPHETDSKLKDS